MSDQKKLYGIFGLILILLISPMLTGQGLSLEELEKKFGPLPKEVKHPAFFEENPIDSFQAIKNSILNTFFPFGQREEGKQINKQLKTCFSHQKITQAAIEMYNMDHSDGIANFQDSFITTNEGLLVKNKYLKSKLTHPDKRCKYHLFGDPKGIGSKFFIYCSYHGTASKIDGLPEHKRRIEPLKMIVVIFIFVTLIGLIFYFVAKKKRSSN